MEGEEEEGGKYSPASFGKPSLTHCPPVLVLGLVGGERLPREVSTDSTFAPPPLQYPFKWGADIIMHSGRYLLI